MLRETGLHASHWGVGNAVSTIDGTVQEVVDAPDAHVLGAVPIGRWRTIDAACSLAVGGLLDISRVRARDISTALSNAADAVEHHERTLAAGLVRETGKPLSEAEREVAATAAILRNYAGLGSASGTARAVWSDSGAAWGVAAPEAIGVALLVLPWNLPLMITAHKAAAALLARCSIILKPSPLAPRTPMRLAQLLSAGLPEGAVQVVQGDAETARMLISHPSTAVVSFTGASRAGRQVEVLAAESGVKSITELGGKSASIIFEDADLERAVRETFRAAMRNQGATCTAPARLLCSRTVLPEVEELMRDVQQSVVVADPYEEATTMGALRHVVADDRMAALLLDLEQASVEVSGGEGSRSKGDLAATGRRPSCSTLLLIILSQPTSCSCRSFPFEPSMTTPMPLKLLMRLHLDFLQEFGRVTRLERRRSRVHCTSAPSTSITMVVKIRSTFRALGGVARVLDRKVASKA